MDKPLLSIYIPTYNRADKVVHQLRFLLREIKDIDAGEIELIVNNNCSTDDTEHKVLETIKGTQVVYHKNDTNLGICGNGYAAVDFVHGKYFWLIGDDDYLHEGIVKRVYEILTANPRLSNVFLNYSDVSNIETRVYNGRFGLIKDGAAYFSGEGASQIHVMIFTTSNIYLREGLVRAVTDLPMSECESYGWTAYGALASMKMGETWLEEKMWTHSDSNNKSWNDIVYESNMGSTKMFAKLKNVGYTKKEISSIYKSYLTFPLVGGRVIARLLATWDFKVFWPDFWFCFRKAPGNVIWICFRSLVSRVKRIGKNEEV